MDTANYQHGSQHRVAILANPTAGSGPARERVHDLVRTLKQKGLEPTVCWQREALTSFLNAYRQETRCVVAAGGDGTVGEVLNRAPGLPLAILPIGTENLVARHFGIGRGGGRLAAAIAAGPCKQLDLGQANGRRFALMASAGYDAAVVHRLHRHRRGHINRLTYLLPMVWAMRSYPFPAIEVEIMETGERLQGALVLLFNLPQYGPGLPVAADAIPDDGRLDLWVFQHRGRVNMIRYLLAVLRRKHGALSDVQHRLVESVRLWSAESVPLQIDGDPAGHLPATVQALPAALRLVVTST